MNRQTLFRWITVLTMVVAGGNAGVSALVSTTPPQHTSTPTGKLLQKSVDSVGTQAVNSARPDITVRLYGLQTGDLINIRPKAARIAASAGTVVKAIRSYEKIPFDAVSPGAPPPETALEVTSDTVTFSRPTLFDGVVFLDIEVPLRARVQVWRDDELVLRASLTQPLSFRDREWQEGALGISGTAMRAAIPLINKLNIPDQFAYDQSRGSYVVPFQKLEVLKKKPLNDQQGQSVVVVLQIDETGQVVGVTPLTGTPPVDLERTLRKWRFVPFMIQGRAVPVTTTLKLTFDR